LHAGAALAVACHIQECETCRREAAVWESAGGHFLLDTPPAALADDALDRVLERIDGGAEPRPEPASKLPRFLERFAVPAPLHGQRIGFRRWVTPDIWFAPVHMHPKAEALTYLVYAKQGTTLARHTHKGREFTSVLHGSFCDDSGTFARGDFAEAGEETVHAPTIVSETECLCLIGADSPMRLFGLPARMIQTLAGNLY
jgi:putative transcriptional regulator